MYLFYFFIIIIIFYYPLVGVSANKFTIHAITLEYLCIPQQSVVVVVVCVGACVDQFNELFCFSPPCLSCQWVPRRVAAGCRPRPIHLIRHEVYQEKQGGGGGGRGHSGTGSCAAPPSSLDLGQQDMRGIVLIISRGK